MQYYYHGVDTNVCMFVLVTVSIGIVFNLVTTNRVGLVGNLARAFRRLTKGYIRNPWFYNRVEVATICPWP